MMAPLFTDNSLASNKSIRVKFPLKKIKMMFQGLALSQSQWLMLKISPSLPFYSRNLTLINLLDARLSFAKKSLIFSLLRCHSKHP